MYNNLENRNDFNNENVILQVYTSFIEQKNIDRTTLFSIKAPFELIHADIADNNFLAKPSVVPVYCLLFVDLFTSKVYTYPMKKRSLLKNKLEVLYKKILPKGDMKKTMRIQTDLEFQQNEIKKLSKKYNVEMFSIRLRGDKVIAAEQKIRELIRLLLESKTRYKREKITINPCKLSEKATDNLRKLNRKKYEIAPETV